MHDSKDQPTDETNVDVPAESTGDSAPAAAKPEKPRKIPLGPPVFGRLCWIVTVVPYVLYLGGMGFASYVEGSRAHSCIKRQEHRALDPFYSPAKVRFARESGETTEAGKNAYVAKKFSEIGLTRLNEEFTSLTEASSEEVRSMIAPILQGPAPVEDRQWLIALYEKAKEPTEFLDKLLEYDEKGRLRPILYDYYQKFPDEDKTPEGVDAGKMWFRPDRTWYPATYTMVIGLTALVMLLVFPLYFRHPFKLTWWSVAVGVVGIFVWLGLWWLDTEMLGLSKMLTKGGREAFNPLEELADTPTWKMQFMAIRFLGLCVIVPFVEEFFLRGWLMRYIEDPDWDRIPIGAATKLSIIGVAVYAVFSHTYEPLAAIVWFSMVTWLCLKTKSIWDCVVAHAITNLLLGIFVIATHTWELW